MASSAHILVLEESNSDKLEEILVTVEQELTSADAEFQLVMEEIRTMDAFSQAILAAAQKMGFPSSKHLIETVGKIDSRLDSLEKELREAQMRANQLQILRQDLDTVEDKLRQDIDELQSRLVKYKTERTVKDILVDYFENKLA